LTLSSANPGLRARALVLTGAGTPREDEERAALRALCPGAVLDVTVLGLPDGRLPAHWAEARAAAQSMGSPSTELVLAPQRADAHQDHRLLAELVPTVFRDQLVLGYEILKWEGDLPDPTVYQPLPAAVFNRKVELLMQCYPSQHSKDWFDRESFLALGRIRGVQCRSRYAEAFVADKITVNLA